jgi:hypothetical protein
MQESSYKPHRSLSLTRAVLAPALAIFLLGAAAPPVAAATVSDNFNTDGGISPGTNLPPNWVPYLLPNSYYDPNQQANVIDFAGIQINIGEDTYYGQGTYYYPTNPASAANYAFRITCPTITNDPVGLYYSRAGAFRPDATYTGRFLAGIDMVSWNTTWNDQAMGLAFYANVDNPLNPATYAIGWGPGLNAIGIIVLQVTGDYPAFELTYGIIGAATGEGGAVLNTNHQYRFTASSHNGTDFMVQCFDTLQPNSPWQSAITTDTTLTGGYCGMLVANTQDVGPDMNQGGDATFDNFISSVPAAGAMPATVTDLSPPPAGRATASLVEVGIYNRDTSVNTGTIGLYLDGQRIVSGVNISNYVYKPHNNDQLGTITELHPTNFPGATVYYAITNVFPLGSVHTNSVVFRDSANTWFTNNWSWTVGYVGPFAAGGSLSQRGFDARMVRSSVANIGAAVNLVANGNFLANAVAFTTWPGYADGANPNPGTIAGWVNTAGGMNTKGINGAGTGSAVGTPFGPTASAGYTFLFMQGAGNELGQNLTGLAPGTTYRLSYDVASRLNNLGGSLGAYQVVVATDSPATILYDSGVVVGNETAFQHVTGSFTTPSPLTGTENIQLLNVSPPGDEAVDFANVSITPIGYANLPISVASAQAVLNYQYAVDLAATNWVQVVAFGLAGTEYGAISNFPGLCPMPQGGQTPQGNSFAVEALAYLQLPAGTNYFSVYSDDAVGVFTGTNLTDTSTVLLATTGLSTSPFAFTWVAPQAGLYPIHIVHEQGGGSAYLVLNSVNPTANTTNLVNSSSGIQAYYPLVCMSSTSVKGPFTLDAAANAGNVLQTAGARCEGGTGSINHLTVTGGTITVPIPTASKYYRLDGPRKTRITSFTKSGSNMIINYQAY